MSKRYWAFLRGVIAASGGLMAYQDWLGLEAYLAHAREHWIDPHWTVGGGLLLAACVCQVFVEIEDRVTRKRDRLRREVERLKGLPPGTCSS